MDYLKILQEKISLLLNKLDETKVLNKSLESKNENLINIVDKEFKVEKELLLALMGIETNYGTYLGKMDIISSLATLSYDKRRSEFFSNELITILKLIDQNKVDKNILLAHGLVPLVIFSLCQLQSLIMP